MKTERTFNRKLSLLGWGLLFLWWGLRWWPLAALPNGAGLLGTGLILLGVNAARLWKGIPTVEGTTWVGILTLILGGLLVLSTNVFHRTIELPLFEISLIVIGLVFFVRALRSRQNVSDV
jgi:hypothetical protein